ncbi:rho gtpase activator [Ophiostoma piceae UAMH 11346]|uniref:Rho gtpase activator n=1 Tax=Ophiostoma piceae (strain UAMH 11346) TaxID=1262450 RepID=S3BSA8_OPHP1|nr:rho gtpase activator [Ophiostoma piceae UAMH 11346]
MTASGHPPLASQTAISPNTTQTVTMQQPPQQPHQQMVHPPRPNNVPSPLGLSQPLTPNAPHHPLSPSSPPSASVPSAASPPTKRDLKSWWKNFKLQSRNHEPQAQAPRGIFGVPLHQSIIYANVAISLIDDNGASYIYGYVPIVVAKCGVYLKEKATEVEGIFRLSGSEKRIKELKLAFDSPDRYGKGLSWAGYTVHDAANVLRRYLNDLPEPVVPLAFYEHFREPLRYAVKPTLADGDGPQFIENFDMTRAIGQYQHLITELPALHRQLLLYILDLLAVFAAKADTNRMNSQNLAAIFQPGILSHPNHAMAPEEYRLNQTVLIFLIENQDSFLIGMRGTAADEQTVQNVERGTPPVTPGPQISEPQAIGVTRTASNASAGAESVARDGKFRRNRSTSSRNSHHSRHSRHSNSNSIANNLNNLNNHIARPGSPRSSSPAIATTPTSLSNGAGGLSRSNTLPARSPGLGVGRFGKRSDPAGSSPVSPLTPIHPHPVAQATPAFESVQEVATPAEDFGAPDPFTTVATPSLRRITPVPGLGLSPATPVSPGSPLAPPPAVAEPGTGTPTKEKRFHLFQRSNTNEMPGELKPTPNKLKKKRLPSSANPSAQSSTASLQPSSAFASPSYEPATNPLDDQVKRNEYTSAPALAAALLAPTARAAVSPLAPSAPGESVPSQLKQSMSPPAVPEEQDSTPRVSQVPSVATTATVTPISSSGAEKQVAPDPKLRPQRNSPSTSLHSSFNEGSEIDQVDESPAAHNLQETAVGESPDKAKKKRWRLSRRNEESQQSSLTAGALQQSIAPQPSTSSLGASSNSPGQQPGLGSNDRAGLSTSSVGSGGPSVAGMGSLTLASVGGSDSALALADTQASADSNGRDEHGKGKLTGWLKNKYREAKETGRNKSPSPTDQSASTSSLTGVIRGKSLDIGRAADVQEKPSE